MTTQKHLLARFDIDEKNADFSIRAQEHSRANDWLKTNAEGVTVKFIEAVDVGHLRVTMLINFAPGSHYELNQHHGGEEFFVISGSIRDDRGQYHPGYYVRNPSGHAHTPVSDDGCLLFLKLGEFSDQDREYRVINTQKDSEWLPGPIEGTQVMPLHMHDTRSVLMIRWDKEASFKPGLDPKGEEIFVLKGLLEDEFGSYGPGTWIRNPELAWQSWKGQPGTLAYYNNGHFPTTTKQGNTAQARTANHPRNPDRQ